MRRYLLAACLSLAFLPGRAQRDTTDRVYTEDAVPAFTLVAGDGVVTPSTAFAGKVVLICFFATWCPPCQLKLAEIEKTLWPKFKTHPDFVLLVIGRAHSASELEVYNARKGFTFPLYPDGDRQIFNTFASQLIPRSYLVDRSGKIIHVAKGYDPKDFTRLQRMIDNELATSPV